MRYTKMPIAAEREGDSPAMAEAIRRLIEAGIDVRRPGNNSHQLKVNSSTSYYPARGTIFIDGEPAALEQRGLCAVLNYLEAPTFIDSVSIGRR